MGKGIHKGARHQSRRENQLAKISFFSLLTATDVTHTFLRSRCMAAHDWFQQPSRIHEVRLSGR
jgi:hypothetical protein